MVRFCLLWVECECIIICGTRVKPAELAVERYQKNTRNLKNWQNMLLTSFT